jgi:uncharacterized DUF497 family protein
MATEFEWDEDKAAVNFITHGVVSRLRWLSSSIRTASYSMPPDEKTARTGSRL